MIGRMAELERELVSPRSALTSSADRVARDVSYRDARDRVRDAKGDALVRLYDEAVLHDDPLLERAILSKAFGSSTGGPIGATYRRIVEDFANRHPEAKRVLDELDELTRLRSQAAFVNGHFRAPVAV